MGFNFQLNDFNDFLNHVLFFLKRSFSYIFEIVNILSFFSSQLLGVLLLMFISLPCFTARLPQNHKFSYKWNCPALHGHQWPILLLKLFSILKSITATLNLGNLMARFKFFNVNFFAGVMSFCMNISAGADGFMDVSLSSPADMFGFDLKARCTCVSSQKKAAQKSTPNLLNMKVVGFLPPSCQSYPSFNVNTDFFNVRLSLVLSSGSWHVICLTRFSLCLKLLPHFSLMFVFLWTFSAFLSGNLFPHISHCMGFLLVWGFWTCNLRSAFRLQVVWQSLHW